MALTTPSVDAAITPKKESDDDDEDCVVVVGERPVTVPHIALEFEKRFLLLTSDDTSDPLYECMQYITRELTTETVHTDYKTPVKCRLLGYLTAVHDYYEDNRIRFYNMNYFVLMEELVAIYSNHELDMTDKILRTQFKTATEYVRFVKGLTVKLFRNITTLLFDSIESVFHVMFKLKYRLAETSKMIVRSMYLHVLFLVDITDMSEESLIRYFIAYQCIRGYVTMEEWAYIQNSMLRKFNTKKIMVMRTPMMRAIFPKHLTVKNVIKDFMKLPQTLAKNYFSYRRMKDTEIQISGEGIENLNNMPTEFAELSDYLITILTKTKEGSSRKQSKKYCLGTRDVDPRDVPQDSRVLSDDVTSLIELNDSDEGVDYVEHKIQHQEIREFYSEPMEPEVTTLINLDSDSENEYTVQEPEPHYLSELQKIKAAQLNKSKKQFMFPLPNLIPKEKKQSVLEKEQSVSGKEEHSVLLKGGYIEALTHSATPEDDHSTQKPVENIVPVVEQTTEQTEKPQLTSADVEIASVSEIGKTAAKENSCSNTSVADDVDALNKSYPLVKANKEAATDSEKQLETVPVSKNLSVVDKTVELDIREKQVKANNTTTVNEQPIVPEMSTSSKSTSNSTILEDIRRIHDLWISISNEKSRYQNIGDDLDSDFTPPEEQVVEVPVIKEEENIVDLDVTATTTDDDADILEPASPKQEVDDDEENTDYAAAPSSPLPPEDMETTYQKATRSFGYDDYRDRYQSHRLIIPPFLATEEGNSHAEPSEETSEEVAQEGDATEDTVTNDHAQNPLISVTAPEANNALTEENIDALTESLATSISITTPEVVVKEVTKPKSIIKKSTVTLTAPEKLFSTFENEYNTSTKELDEGLRGDVQTKLSAAYYENTDINLFPLLPLASTITDTRSPKFEHVKDFEDDIYEFYAEFDGKKKEKKAVQFRDKVDTIYIPKVNHRSSHRNCEMIMIGNIKCFVHSDDWKVFEQPFVPLQALSQTDLVRKYNIKTVMNVHNTMRTCIQEKYNFKSPGSHNTDVNHSGNVDDDVVGSCDCVSVHSAVDSDVQGSDTFPADESISNLTSQTRDINNKSEFSQFKSSNTNSSSDAALINSSFNSEMTMGSARLDGIDHDVKQVVINLVDSIIAKEKRDFKINKEKVPARLHCKIPPPKLTENLTPASNTEMASPVTLGGSTTCSVGAMVTNKDAVHHLKKEHRPRDSHKTDKSRRSKELLLKHSPKSRRRDEQKHSRHRSRAPSSTASLRDTKVTENVSKIGECNLAAAFDCVQLSKETPPPKECKTSCSRIDSVHKTTQTQQSLPVSIPRHIIHGEAYSLKRCSAASTSEKTCSERVPSTKLASSIPLQTSVRNESIRNTEKPAAIPRESSSTSGHVRTIEKPRSSPVYVSKNAISSCHEPPRVHKGHKITEKHSSQWTDDSSTKKGSLLHSTTITSTSPRHALVSSDRVKLSEKPHSQRLDDITTKKLASVPTTQIASCALSLEQSVTSGTVRTIENFRSLQVEDSTTKMAPPITIASTNFHQPAVNESVKIAEKPRSERTDSKKEPTKLTGKPRSERHHATTKSRRSSIKIPEKSRSERADEQKTFPPVHATPIAPTGTQEPAPISKHVKITEKSWSERNCHSTRMKVPSSHSSVASTRSHQPSVSSESLKITDKSITKRSDHITVKKEPAVHTTRVVSTSSRGPGVEHVKITEKLCHDNIALTKDTASTRSGRPSVTSDTLKITEVSVTDRSDDITTKKVPPIHTTRVTSTSPRKTNVIEEHVKISEKLCPERHEDITLTNVQTIRAPSTRSRRHSVTSDTLNVTEKAVKEQSHDIITKKVVHRTSVSSTSSREPGVMDEHVRTTEILRPKLHEDITLTKVQTIHAASTKSRRSYVTSETLKMNEKTVKEQCDDIITKKVPLVHRTSVSSTSPRESGVMDEHVKITEILRPEQHEDITLTKVQTIHAASTKSRRSYVTSETLKMTEKILKEQSDNIITKKVPLVHRTSVFSTSPREPGVMDEHVEITEILRPERHEDITVPTVQTIHAASTKSRRSYVTSETLKVTEKPDKEQSADMITKKVPLGHTTSVTSTSPRETSVMDAHVKITEKLCSERQDDIKLMKVPPMYAGSTRSRRCSVTNETLKITEKLVTEQSDDITTNKVPHVHSTSVTSTCPREPIVMDEHVKITEKLRPEQHEDFTLKTVQTTCAASTQSHRPSATIDSLKNTEKPGTEQSDDITTKKVALVHHTTSVISTIPREPSMMDEHVKITEKLLLPEQHEDITRRKAQTIHAASTRPRRTYVTSETLKNTEKPDKEQSDDIITKTVASTSHREPHVIDEHVKITDKLRSERQDDITLTEVPPIHAPFTRSRRYSVTSDTLKIPEKTVRKQSDDIITKKVPPIHTTIGTSSSPHEPDVIDEHVKITEKVCPESHNDIALAKVQAVRAASTKSRRSSLTSETSKNTEKLVMEQSDDITTKKVPPVYTTRVTSISPHEPGVIDQHVKISEKVCSERHDDITLTKVETIHAGRSRRSSMTCETLRITEKSVTERPDDITTKIVPAVHTTRLVSTSPCKPGESHENVKITRQLCSERHDDIALTKVQNIHAASTRSRRSSMTSETLKITEILVTERSDDITTKKVPAVHTTCLGSTSSCEPRVINEDVKITRQLCSERHDDVALTKVQTIHATSTRSRRSSMTSETLKITEISVTERSDDITTKKVPAVHTTSVGSTSPCEPRVIDEDVKITRQLCSEQHDDIILTKVPHIHATSTRSHRPSVTSDTSEKLLAEQYDDIITENLHATRASSTTLHESSVAIDAVRTTKQKVQLPGRINKSADKENVVVIEKPEGITASADKFLDFEKKYNNIIEVAAIPDEDIDSCFQGDVQPKRINKRRRSKRYSEESNICMVDNKFGEEELTIRKSDEELYEKIQDSDQAPLKVSKRRRSSRLSGETNVHKTTTLRQVDVELPTRKDKCKKLCDHITPAKFDEQLPRSPKSKVKSDSEQSLEGNQDNQQDPKKITRRRRSSKQELPPRRDKSQKRNNIPHVKANKSSVLESDSEQSTCSQFTEVEFDIEVKVKESPPADEKKKQAINKIYNKMYNKKAEPHCSKTNHPRFRRRLSIHDTHNLIDSTRDHHDDTKSNTETIETSEKSKDDSLTSVNEISDHVSFSRLDRQAEANPEYLGSFKRRHHRISSSKIKPSVQDEHTSGSGTSVDVPSLQMTDIESPKRPKSNSGGVTATDSSPKSQPNERDPKRRTTARRLSSRDKTSDLNPISQLMSELAAGGHELESGNTLPRIEHITDHVPALPTPDIYQRNVVEAVSGILETPSVPCDCGHVDHQHLVDENNYLGKAPMSEQMCLGQIAHNSAVINYGQSYEPLSPQLQKDPPPDYSRPVIMTPEMFPHNFVEKMGISGELQQTPSYQECAQYLAPPPVERHYTRQPQMHPTHRSSLWHATYPSPIVQPHVYSQLSYTTQEEKISEYITPLPSYQNTFLANRPASEMRQPMYGQWENRLEYPIGLAHHSVLPQQIGEHHGMFTTQCDFAVMHPESFTMRGQAIGSGVITREPVASQIVMPVEEDVDAEISVGSKRRQTNTQGLPPKKRRRSVDTMGTPDITTTGAIASTPDDERPLDLSKAGASMNPYTIESLRINTGLPQRILEEGFRQNQQMVSIAQVVKDCPERMLQMLDEKARQRQPGHQMMQNDPHSNAFF